VLLAALVAVPATASAATAPSPALLTCSIRTAPNQPLTFNPPLKRTPQNTTLSSTLNLSGCTGSQGGIQSGQLTVSGSGRASCTSVEGVQGSGKITWFGANGRSAGTSNVAPANRSANTSNPGEALLTGRVSGGVMNGAQVSGTATPTSSVTGCALGGLKTVHGSGKITFRR
jgi:hypothetical protein